VTPGPIPGAAGAAPPAPDDPHGGQPVVTIGPPPAPGGAAMIMIHGRNAAPANILDLVPVLRQPAFSYLAPAAAGRTWYPNSFLAPIPSNEPGISSGLRAIARLVDDVVARGVPRERIILLGFSQGACLTSEFALRHPARYGGVVAFTGGLIGPPGTAWPERGSFAGTPIFLGGSDIDAHVPKERIEETAAIFTRMGAKVTRRIYPGMAHIVNEDELAFARAMMSQVLG
jgi:predicted esterase